MRKDTTSVEHRKSGAGSGSSFARYVLTAGGAREHQGFVTGLREGMGLDGLRRKVPVASRAVPFDYPGVFCLPLTNPGNHQGLSQQ